MRHDTKSGLTLLIKPISYETSKKAFKQRLSV
ncbi:hypothetical protein SPYJRS4_1724 [Streptococcus pyogenes JRS4]|nr:hypothetical protein SPYJRS4_1724 [Streptococcus pyogenes JRS4]